MTYVHTYCTHVHTRTGCAEPIWTGQNGAMSAFCGKVHANNYDAGFKDDDDAEQGTAVQAPTVVYDVRLFNSSSFLRSLKHACLHPSASCTVHCCFFFRWTSSSSCVIDWNQSLSSTFSFSS